MKFHLQSNTKTENLIASIKQQQVEFKTWKQSLDGQTLAQVWETIGVTEKVSPKGHPSLVVGEGSTVLCENNISGLNALADLPKYRVLNWHEHVAWFDPTLNCSSVRVVWDNDHYEVYDWKNGSFTRSILSLPYSEIRSQRMRDNKRNLYQKHAALDALCQAQEFGNAFMVVLHDDQSKEHYLNEIKKFSEAPYTEYSEARNARWEAAQLARSLSLPDRRMVTVRYPEREELIKALATLENSVVVVATNPSGRPVHKVYNPADQKACDNLIAGIRAASPVVSFALEGITE